MEYLIRILIATIPSLFYIYLYTRYIKDLAPISFKDTYKFVGLGLMSPFIVYATHFFLPIFHYDLAESVNLNIFLNAFIQVALLEEVSKYLVFKLNEDSIKENNKIQIQFYYAMCSIGFAIHENITYALMKLPFTEVFSLSIHQVLFRNLSAIVIHLGVGILGGYFIATYKDKNSVLLAIGIATLFHGLYDFNLMSHYNILIRLGIMILLIYMIIKDCKKSIELLKEDYDKKDSK